MALSNPICLKSLTFKALENYTIIHVQDPRCLQHISFVRYVGINIPNEASYNGLNVYVFAVFILGNLCLSACIAYLIQSKQRLSIHMYECI